MTVWDRFKEFWARDTDSKMCEFSLFEWMAYSVFGVLFVFPLLAVALVTCPVWCIPYMMVKSKRGR